MKILNIVVIVIFSIFSQSCASTGSGNINKQDDCKVPGLDWMEGVEGYDKKEVYELAAKFKAAAKANADIVRLSKDANTEGSLTGSLSQILYNTTGRKVKVSPEFFERANAYRTAVCMIISLLKEGIISDPALRKSAQKLLLDLSADFNSIATELSELKDDIKNIHEDLNEKNRDIQDLKVKAKKAERGIITTYDFNGIKRETGRGKFLAEMGSETQIFIEMQTLEQQKKYQELIPICEEWIEKTPEWLTPYFYLGKAYANLGNKEKAIELFEHVQRNALGDSEYSQVNDFLKELKGN